MRQIVVLLCLCSVSSVTLAARVGTAVTVEAKKTLEGQPVDQWVTAVFAPIIESERKVQVTVSRPAEASLPLKDVRVYMANSEKKVLEMKIVPSAPQATYTLYTTPYKMERSESVNIVSELTETDWTVVVEVSQGWLPTDINRLSVSATVDNQGVTEYQNFYWNFNHEFDIDDLLVVDEFLHLDTILI